MVNPLLRLVAMFCLAMPSMASGQGVEAVPFLSDLSAGERLSVPSRRANADKNSPALSSAPALESAAPPVSTWNDLSFDDVVAVGDDGGLRCSGVLVGPRQVLTARHCLPSTRVLFGHDVLRPFDSRAVVAVRSPPDPAVDVALLFLAAPINIPQALRRGTLHSRLPSGSLRAVGFGSSRRRFNVAYGRKRFIDLPAMGWNCDASRARDTGCQPDLEMLLANPVRRDTCEGDSGGPVYERVGQARRLLAITSRSTDGAHVICGEGGIYVRLDRIAEWLEPLLENNSPSTPQAFRKEK